MKEAHQQVQSPAHWERRITDNDLRFGAVSSECHLPWDSAPRFDEYQSYPQGSGYLLGWSRSERRTDTSAIQDHQNAWRRMVDALDGARALAAEVRERGRPKDAKALARLFRERFKDPAHPTRTRADLRQRFDRAILTLLFLLFLYNIAEILLLLFIAVLFSLYLSSITDLLQRHLRIPRPAGLLIALVIIALPENGRWMNRDKSEFTKNRVDEPAALFHNR